MKNPAAAPPETIFIATHSVACDGGGGPLGHPRIYMTIEHETNTATCGYCDRLFVYDPAKAGGPVRSGH